MGILLILAGLLVIYVLARMFTWVCMWILKGLAGTDDDEEKIITSYLARLILSPFSNGLGGIDDADIEEERSSG